jgi:hypothetical protein
MRARITMLDVDQGLPLHGTIVPWAELSWASGR